MRVDDVLTPDAVSFLTDLEREFGERRRELLARRAERLRRLTGGGPASGELPDFLPDTAGVREGDWRIAPFPEEIADRRVEITGPVDRKMVINALNSGARVFMADFEDANSPTWSNVVEGQQNLIDAVRREISLDAGEKHATLDGEPVSGSLFDFGLYLFHNGAELVKRGTGPYLYLPKLESHLEARLWNDVFVHAQDALGLPGGTIRATVLIETILAAFEMDAILYELRDHSAGLNAGRWDYIFSAIKRFRTRPDFVLPDR